MDVGRHDLGEKGEGTSDGWDKADSGTSEHNDEKCADVADAVSQKLDRKTRIAIRNLRIHDDTAGYLKMIYGKSRGKFGRDIGGNMGTARSGSCAAGEQNTGMDLVQGEATSVWIGGEGTKGATRAGMQLSELQVKMS